MLIYLYMFIYNIYIYVNMFMYNGVMSLQIVLEGPSFLSILYVRHIEYPTKTSLHQGNKAMYEK